MEYPSKRQRVSRIQRRRPAPDAPVGRDEIRIQNLRQGRAEEEDKDSPVMDIHEPLLVREHRRRTLEEGLRLSRRQPAVPPPPPPPERTVTISVVALVDGTGATQTLETLNPEAVPTVPAFPSDLTVPAVPTQASVALPQVPTVPSFPFHSNAASTDTGTTGPPPSTALTTYPATNTNTLTPGSSTLSSSTILIPVTTTTSTSTASSFTSTSASSSTTTSPSRTSTRLSSTSRSSGAATSSTEGAAGPPGSATSAASSSAPNTGNGGGGGGGVPTAKVVGGVLGGLAGLALLLILALLFLRWFKKKRRAQGQLAAGEGDSVTAPITSAPTPMAQTGARGVLPPAAASLWNRMSGRTSMATTTTTDTGERGFQRISGRKLPSAFSEGMSSDTFAAGGRDTGTLSETSFYRDSQGFYGGVGTSPSAAGAGPSGGGPGMKDIEKEVLGKEAGIGREPGKETLMPSPARTPVVHHPGASGGGAFLSTPRPPGTPGSSFSPPSSPRGEESAGRAEPRGTLGRSLPSHDGSRGSKFTEDV